MTAGLDSSQSLLAVAGVRLAVAAAALRYKDRPDLTLIELAAGSQVATVFTRNAFCAAPVVVAKQHLAEQPSPRYLLINAGNANAGTGEAGLQAARECCSAVAQLMDCELQQVMPFSTGVIGEPLSVEPIARALPGLKMALSEDAWMAAAGAIMTTDTLHKGISRTLILDNRPVTITGIAKGSGMICPDMATMLAFIATDADMPQAMLEKALREAVATSFNCITVDGDTSTNDACMLMATGKSGVSLAKKEAHYQAFMQGLNEVMRYLAQAIVRDGEGATKFISVRVNGAHEAEEARRVCYTVAHSPLVKTAFFASDPNWGRILAAVGRAGVASLDINKVRLYLDDVCIVRDGGVDAGYREAAGQAVMDKTDIVITIELGCGEHSAEVWTSDLSYDYVRINADYRS